ncbi:trypsin-like serine protease [Pedobacter sp. LMG 31464]|uniref:Trypsin-like serine protease n=1 Tax=Pedobacter planticolens TaxID=2679964 RepID=A0A923IU90_9SPHI|nr:trypsin-like serine protease [Pedobacter planticolens]MBB2144631.1 trypsin-like serine protease [Pedobacter planticolens]
MPKKILNQCCVRTYLMHDGKRVNQGSGVIVTHDEKFFVLTAEHCIAGENDEFKDIDPENIIIEYQDDFSAPFQKINVLSVFELDKINDWALLEIEKPNIDCDFMQVKLGDKFVMDEGIYFRGYQSYNDSSPRTWEGSIIDLAQKEFKITIKGTFEQGGELGANLAKGLSGSGVYMIRGNTLYLIGHLKNVIGEIALNNDIMCCKLTNLNEKLNKRDWTDMGSLNELDVWEKTNQKLVTEEDVKGWIEGHDEYFDKLLRKSKTLYPDEKAETVARERILSFLEQEYKNDQIRNVSDLISKYEATSEVFEQAVKSDYTRTVNTRNEAKDLLLKLQTEFSEHIKDLVNDKSNKRNLELAKHKVTWWLMNCSFNFVE